MIELATHIEYMLLSHDEVSVPLLGTFNVRDMSSRHVDEEGIFLPPYRTVSFQWNEQESGENFVYSLSKLHNLTKNEARIMCAEYVDELRQMLAEEGSVSVGSMGYLLSDSQSQQISFMPFQSGIASPAYYGLDAIFFAKLSNDVRQHRDKKNASRKTKLITIVSDQDTHTIRINRRFCNYVTTVAASIVLFFCFTSPYNTPVATDNQKAESEFMTAPLLLPKGVESKTQKVSPEKDVEAVPKAVSTPTNEVSPQNDIEEAKPYAIVLASAINKTNAVSYADKLQEQGYNAKACEVGGMVRVIIPGYSSQEEAYAAIRQMKAECNDFSKAWPYQLKGEITPIE